MLFSMTGYGEASHQSDDLNCSIELRSVNNRHLKIILRATEPYNLMEAEFDKLIRKTIHRGTIQIHVRCQRQQSIKAFRINKVALKSYLTQVQEVFKEAGITCENSGLVEVLHLPGVIPESTSSSGQIDHEWPVIEEVLVRAITDLQTMRLEEGKAMAAELLQYRDFIADQLHQIRERGPVIAQAHRDRLLERIRSLVRDLDIKIDQSDLIKETSIFAERSDIAEEVVRLASHLDQFQEFLNEPESPGRKLEFLTQEMFRETNTIGSKANDVEISRHVVEIKGTLEKIRELVQNVE